MQNFLKYALLLFCLISISSVNAQTDTDEIPKEMPETMAMAPVENPSKAQPGTFQFFILGNDSTQLQRPDIYQRIEKFRHETSVVHLKVSSTTTIRILPKKEINNPQFVPLKNEVVFQPDYRDVVQK